MKTKLELLRAKLVTIHEEEASLRAKLTETPSAAELAKLEALAAAFEAIDAEVKGVEAFLAREERLDAPQPRVTQAADLEQRQRITGGEPAGAKPGTWGWRTMGELMKAARAAAHGQVDGRLQAAATSYGSEGANADGGFAVPPDFRADIVKKVAAEDSLLARTDQIFTASNRVAVPQDNATPWATSGGIQVYWEEEAAAITQSKPALGLLEVKANKVTALVPLSDELLEDAPVMASFVPNKVGDKLISTFNEKIVNGTGVGQPQGLLNSPSLVSVAKEASQAAATILYANLAKMWARLYAPLRANACWCYNQDIEQQLLQMTAPGSTIPVYMAPNGLSASALPTLFGRPMIPVEACQTLGTKGDIILCDLKSYLTVQKTSGLRQDVSIHFFFDQGLTAFRFIARMGGQSWYSAAITPAKGTATRSNIISLDTRA